MNKMNKTDLIGKWKICELMSFGDDGAEWKSVEKMKADNDPMLEELGDMRDMMVEFTAEGEAFMLIPLPADAPQESIDEAIASGELVLRDGCTFEALPWKEEDGKFMYDTGVQGEVFGESVSSWQELTIEDGKLEFMMMYHLEKIA